MFNKEVLQVLQQVNSVTNSIILKYPQTIAVAETGDIQILFDLSKLDSEGFPDIALKDCLSEFLALFKLFDSDRTVQIENNTIQVNSGKQSSTYISSNIALMDAYDKSPEQFQKTEEAPSVSTFILTDEDMKSLKNASGVFKDLSEVIFTSQDGEVSIGLGSTNKFGARDNQYNISKESETTKEFQIKIPVENFKVLPNSTYEVQVKYNSARDNYRIVLINQTLEGFKIMLSVKV